jgi:glycosyltransferase involved in cell wall biosynthesis
MHILLVHNFYQQIGGEDVVFAQEKALLERKGHRVTTYTRTNDEALNNSVFDQLRLARTIVSAQKSRGDITALLRSERPDVVHIHNTFMMISPSIYEACNAAGVPVVQTLHNYRLFCPASTFCRNGRVCEDCVQNGLAAGVLHGCHRGSRASTAAVALMLQVHRAKGTWNNRVDAFIALTRFAKGKFVDCGLPAHKIHVKSNFVEPDPEERGDAAEYALFLGRLSPEKGISTLLEAWELLHLSIPLKIAGDGPLRCELEAICRKSDRGPSIEFLGRVSPGDARALVKKARFVVVPGVWYETFCMAIVESFACGVPVLASRLGAMGELVEDGCVGLKFSAGDAADVAAKVTWAWEHPNEMAIMGRRARQKYERYYAPDANYKRLMEIYGKAGVQPSNSLRSSSSLR